MNEPLTFPGNHCTVHGYHWPKPIRTVRHHILPEAMGGKATKDNLCDVCDTGHYNIHAYFDAMVADLPVPKATRKEREIAIEGYERAKAANVL